MLSGGRAQRRRKLVEDGSVTDARKNGTITMYNQQLAAVAQWSFENAWPVKVTGPSVKSDSTELGVEELTLAHEFIERTS